MLVSGSNDIGRQVQPCVFHVVPAGNFYFFKKSKGIYIIPRIASYMYKGKPYTFSLSFLLRTI